MSYTIVAGSRCALLTDVLANLCGDILANLCSRPLELFQLNVIIMVYLLRLCHLLFCTQWYFFLIANFSRDLVGQGCPSERHETTFSPFVWTMKSPIWFITLHWSTNKFLKLNAVKGKKSHLSAVVPSHQHANVALHVFSHIVADLHIFVNICLVTPADTQYLSWMSKEWRCALIWSLTFLVLSLHLVTVTGLHVSTGTIVQTFSLNGTCKQLILYHKSFNTNYETVVKT